VRHHRYRPSRRHRFIIGTYGALLTLCALPLQSRILCFPVQATNHSISRWSAPTRWRHLSLGPWEHDPEDCFKGLDWWYAKADFKQTVGERLTTRGGYSLVPLHILMSCMMPVAD
jgi:hypothetical protein